MAALELQMYALYWRSTASPCSRLQYALPVWSGYLSVELLWKTFEKVKFLTIQF